MDAVHLATKLAEAMRQVVPEGFNVSERDGMVMISAGSYPCATDVADLIDQPGDLLELVESAAWGALSMVQDFIAEETAKPWPDIGRPFLPIPTVRVTADAIEWWFEDESGGRVLEVPTVRW